jgi:small-conductance mechanosensitive channel
LNRAVIQVGVAYGTDVGRATALLEEVARKHPATLTDPAPFAILTSFDDSALNLSLRYYLGSLSGRSKIRSELAQAIIAAFAEEGIEIPFPQRDVHLKPRPGKPPVPLKKDPGDGAADHP